MTGAIVSPDFLRESVLDTESPRTRIRHSKLNRHFGDGNWTEIYVDAVFGGGTVQVGSRSSQWKTGEYRDWFPDGSRLKDIPA